MSAFMLSLLSPVLRAMMCGSFREARKKTITLDDVKMDCLVKLLHLACGVNGLFAKDINELLDLAELADRLQMEAVTKRLEDILLRELRVDNCAEMIQWTEARGLRRVQVDCYNFIRDHFEIIAAKDSFLMLSEETMSNLLDEDALGAFQEENVFEALLHWMSNDQKKLRGEGLLRKIRYGVIDDKCLAEKIMSALPGHSELKALVRESIVKKGAAAQARSTKAKNRKARKAKWDGVERLCDKWMVAREMKDTILAKDVLRSPRHVAIDREGRLVVTDTFSVIVLHRDGSIARRFGSFGTAKGQFLGPLGIAVNSQGKIVVSDKYNDRIQVLSADGSVELCFGSTGKAVGQLRYPRGLAVDSEDNIVVADWLNDRIQVFSSDGAFLRQFGSGGLGAATGKLRYPTAVAVDQAGHIVVAEEGNHRVQVFNRDGSVAMCFGSEGDGHGQFRKPQGVSVDEDGRIVVADTGNNRVQIFDSKGRFVSVVGELNSPTGVVIDGSGRIVLVEDGRLRVLRAGVSMPRMLPSRDEASTDPAAVIPLQPGRIGKSIVLWSALFGDLALALFVYFTVALSSDAT